MLKGVTILPFLKCFKIIWTLACIFATLLTVAKQYLNYLDDEDVTRIDYKMFHESRMDRYPSIGLCFSLPINEDNFQQYGEQITP